MDEKNKGKKGAIARFDETDLKNIIYREVIQILEPLEGSGAIKRNTHHLTQEICERLSPVIMEKIASLSRK